MRSVFLKIICVDLLLLSAVHAGTFTNNFSSSTPTGFTLNGGNRPAPNDTLIYPAIEGGILKLTYAENGETGSIVLDELDPGATNAGFTARFTVQIGGGSSTPADGWTLHFGSDIDSSSKFGEEGPGVPASGSGIDICFDTYDNGGGEAPAIDVKVNGVQVAHTPESVFFMLSDNFTNVFIQLNPNGTLNVSYKGQVIYTNLYLPGYAPVTGGRFAIGARTGGLNENNWFDDLGITTTVAGAPAAPTITAQNQPQSQTVNERSPVSFSVLPDGTPPFNFQWLSNNVAIANETNISYTIPNAPFSANGAKYKVQVGNAVSNIVSAEATLTVNQDTVAPTIASVRGSEAFNTVTVVFSEPVTAASAGNLNNYSFSGGLTRSAVTIVNSTTVTLTTSAQTPGTTYTLTVTGIQDTATIPNTIAANTTANFASFALSQGFLKFEYWGNIPSPGTPAVSELTDDPRYQANTPDLVGFISPFDTRSIFPDDSHETYGARISGFIVPTETADYNFMLRSDDASQLFLSTDATTGNLALIAEETGCCDPFKEPNPGTDFETTQAPIHLLANQRYAVQALYKEGGGGDYCQVAWRKVGDATPAAQLSPISGAFLAAYADPGAASVNFTLQPQNQTRPENSKATLTAAATGSPSPLFFQWQRAESGSANFVNIPGATAASYTTPILKVATDNGAKYRVAVSVPGLVANSAQATLTVVLDTTPPTLTSVRAGENFKGVTAFFSEGLNPATAVAATNYSIPGLTISNATVLSANSVHLITSVQPELTTFTLTVTGVRDEAGNVIDPLANSMAFTSLKLVPGGVKWEVYTGIGGTPVAALTGSPNYPNSPFEARLFAGFDSPNGYSDNFGARMSGFVVPPETADYDFFIRSDDASQLFISTNDDPANLSATPIAQEPGCCNAFLEPPASQTTASPIHLIAGQRYFVLALYKEGGGGDYCQVAMRKAGDPTAANQLTPISGSLVAVSVDKALADSITLPVSLMSPPGSGDASKPGFNARIYQVDQSGANNVATLIASAEHELAGIIGPNVANLAGASGGVFSIDTIVNWNQEFDTGGDGVTEAGDFQSTSTPSRPDVGIPGMPGNGTAAHNLDSIAGELVTYVEFSAAGVYLLGVNSDDGFKLTAAETPPANNQALVVTSPASAAGAYHAVSGGNESSGGAFRPITTTITGKLVYANPPDACSPILNTNEMAGNIALIDRGVCTFSAKVQAALDAGAIAVVVVNSRDPSSSDGKYPILMTGTLVDLPAVMITKPDGAIIKTGLGQGNVTVSITPDTSPVLGKYNAGRGASDTVFPVIVPAPGVYPLRCVWFEGGGGANLEWFSVTSTGQKILLNDSGTPGALKAYRARSGVLQFNPPTLSGNSLTITWTGTGRLQEATTLTGNASDWSTVSNPTNPYMVQVGTTGKKFYRLINP